MEKKEWSEEEWLCKAAHYCAGAEKAESEVRDKLRQWGVPSSVWNRIIVYLRKENYIDDARYCRAFVHDKVAFQGWGREKIRAALAARHLSGECVREALENIDETVYFDWLRRLKQQNYPADPIRQTRFLLQRGFTLEEIKRPN